MSVEPFGKEAEMFGQPDGFNVLSAVSEVSMANLSAAQAAPELPYAPPDPETDQPISLERWVRADVERLRETGHDALDVLSVKHGAALGSFSVTALAIAIAGGREELIHPSVLLTYTEAAATLVASITAYAYFSRQASSWAVAKAPYVQGYSIEQAVSEPKTGEERQVYTFVLPSGTPEKPATAHADDFIDLAYRAGSDGLVLPAEMAHQADPQSHEVTKSLADIGRQTKGYALHRSQCGKDEQYVLLNRQQLSERGGKESLDELLGLLPTVTGAEHTPEFNNKEDVVSYAGELLPAVARTFREYLSAERSRARDGRKQWIDGRIHRIVRVGRSDDPFTPVVTADLTLQPWGGSGRTRSGGANDTRSKKAETEPLRPGEPQYDQSMMARALEPERLLLGAHYDKQLVHDAIRTGVKDPAQALAVLAATYDRLKELHARFERGAGSDTSQLATQPPDAWHKRQLKERVLVESRLARDRFKKVLGAAAVVAAVVFGVGDVPTIVAEHQASPPPRSETAGVGRAIIPDGPQWRLENHGLNTDGYYGANKLYRLDEQLVWHRDNEPAIPETLPHNVPAEVKHITVEGFHTLDSREWLALPERDGTDVAAVRATDSQGDEVPLRVVASPDGVVQITTEGDPVTADITYDLLRSRRTPGAAHAITVDGIAPGPALPEDTSAELEKTAQAVSQSYTYDNTPAMAALVGSVHSPAEFYDLIRKEGRGNCNIVAAELAIYGARRDNNDPLAYVTGFMADRGYLYVGHGWLANSVGRVIDGTPPATDTPQAVGLGGQIADLSAAWQAQNRRFAESRHSRLPERLPVGIVAMGLMVMAGGRLRYPLRERLARWYSRSLTSAQADAVIAHNAFGLDSPPPDLQLATKRLSDWSLPPAVVARVAADPFGAAPYLTSRQHRSLAYHARTLMD